MRIKIQPLISGNGNQGHIYLVIFPVTVMFFLGLSWLPLPDLYIYIFPWIFLSLTITVTGSVLMLSFLGTFHPSQLPLPDLYFYVSFLQSLMITVTGSVLLYFSLDLSISHDYCYRICTSKYLSSNLSWLPLPDLYFYTFLWISPSLVITVTGSVLFYLSLDLSISHDYCYQICTSLSFLGLLYLPKITVTRFPTKTKF